MSLAVSRNHSTGRLIYRQRQSAPVAVTCEKGLYRMEGKEYVVKDGDVLLFKFNV